MINELNIFNLIQKMVDIYIFKIGGNQNLRKVYEFNLVCNHFDNLHVEKTNKCIEDEFCEKGYLIPRDVATIQTGFNIYILLQLFQKSFPNHPKLEMFTRCEEEFMFVTQKASFYEQHIFKKSMVSSKKTIQSYNQFNNSEQDMLDELIINCFPDTFVAYV